MKLLSGRHPVSKQDTRAGLERGHSMIMGDTTRYPSYPGTQRFWSSIQTCSPEWGESYQSITMGRSFGSYVTLSHASTNQRKESWVDLERNWPFRKTPSSMVTAHYPPLIHVGGKASVTSMKNGERGGTASEGKLLALDRIPPEDHII